MSFITIDKKAVTQEDGAALLEQTYALSDPFGVPVGQVRPDDFEPFDTNLSAYAQYKLRIRNVIKVEPIAKKYIYNVSEESRPYIDMSTEKTIAQLVVALHDPMIGYKANARPYYEKGFGGHAHNYDPKTYKPPRSAIIFTPSLHASGTGMVSFFLNTVLEKPLPGSNEQWQFKTAWHEIAHAAGAGEPQAEVISAVVDRKAFENSDEIRVWADYRALGSVFCEDARVLQKYGWPMVEANDYIAGLSDAAVDCLDEVQIRDIRFQKFDHLAESVHNVGVKLKRAAGVEAFGSRDFGALQQSALEVRRGKGLGEVERRILTRFALACQRISTGVDAYGDGASLIDEELLDSECARPMTFTSGEFVPE